MKQPPLMKETKHGLTHQEDEDEDDDDLKLGCLHPVACTRSTIETVALDGNPEPDDDDDDDDDDD
jgi:hypothetical protein